MIDPFIGVFAFVIGALVGSFLNVCVTRWPRDLSVIRPRSRCPRCGHQLSWFENIPIVSWLALRARCRCCDEPISIQYPVVELIAALGWLAAFNHFGLTLTALRVAVFGTILLGIALTDLRHYVIPDGFTVFGLFWVLATSVVSQAGGEHAVSANVFVGPYDALVGACAGAGFVAIVGWLGEAALKREAMGMGDVTLMAFAGAALGPARAIVTVFAGAVIGVVTFLMFVYPIARVRQTAYREQTELALGGTGFVTPLVPFGVFLAPAALATLLWGDAVLAWLLRG
ncbi:MAG TPA: prepilin peptidase [Gemmatimonadaceae bacterium]|nr:prepilin peptidase [Gemmatimonadaceae bacterium]